MSSLWTPGGEHQVPREQPSQPGPSGGPGDDIDLTGLQLDPETIAALEAMSPEERAQAEQILAARAREMAEQRAAIAAAPAAVVIANHVMGIYELGAIHLSQQPPNLTEAQVAIDAAKALLGSVAGRLGPDEATLVEAINQLQMAYVELSSQAGSPTPDA